MDGGQLAFRNVHLRHVQTDADQKAETADFGYQGMIPAGDGFPDLPGPGCDILLDRFAEHFLEHRQ